MKLKFSSQKGFTLIELLLYMLIFPILLIVLSNLFGNVVDAQLESQSYSSVDLDARYILAKLEFDFQSGNSSDPASNDIIQPAPDSADTTLILKINSVTYTYSASTSGRLQLSKPEIYDLTSSDSTISALMFQRIGTGGPDDSIRVNFRLTSKVQRKQEPEYRDVQTTFAMP